MFSEGAASALQDGKVPKTGRTQCGHTKPPIHSVDNFIFTQLFEVCLVYG